MTREQAMREAAERGLGAWGALLGGDHVDPAQATAGADAERARVVAWLREQCGDPMLPEYAEFLAAYADAIERGEPWPDA